MNLQKQLIAELKIKDDSSNNDYGEIYFSEEYNLNSEDKEEIKHIINEGCNETLTDNKTLSKKIDTSIGSVLIEIKKHPDYSRRKLIKGFLLSNEPDKVISQSKHQLLEKLSISELIFALILKTKSYDEEYPLISDSVIETMQQKTKKFTNNDLNLQYLHYFLLQFIGISLNDSYLLKIIEVVTNLPNNFSKSIEEFLNSDSSNTS